MAKITRTNMPISGKLDNLIYSDGKNGKTVKMAPKPGSKKNTKGLKGNEKSTSLVNCLSSQLNNVIRHYNRRLKPQGFYHRLLGLFRDEKDANRFLYLLQLKNLEINPAYKLEKLFYYDFSVQQHAGKLDVSINVKVHPKEYQYNADCYDCEVLLISWDKTAEAPVTERQLSPWICMNEGLPEITFIFSKRAKASSWVLVLRVRLGIKEEYVEAFVAEGMRIIDVGSFDKEEIALMKKKQEEKSALSLAATKKVVVKEERLGVVKMKPSLSHQERHEH